MSENITICTHCGSEIKGEWNQKELNIMNKYSEKYNNSYIEIKYKKLASGKILAEHLNKMYFNWVVKKEIIDV